jgi:ammonium transporter, Amt family
VIKLKKYLPFLLASCVLPTPAFADVNSGDTAWIMTATALVLLMTPGLAFFYAGMVAKKNAVSTLYQNIISLGLIGLLWVVIGFSLAFSAGSSFIGDASNLLLSGIGQAPDGTATIPHLLFMLFQMMFAIITPVLMTGAFAERIKFRSWLYFLVFWSLAVYSPVAHWVWSANGWLLQAGALDFAGGFVVHMTAGFSALVLAILIGKRKDFGHPHKPYDTGMIVLGTSLLWFGWFGFNGGSALAANGIAAQALVTTFISSAVAMLAWTLIDTIKDGKPTVMGGSIGVVAGLVAITPACGYVSPASAILIGLTAGIMCNLVARIVKQTFQIDDTLDVFACHGIGGLIGSILTGLFADRTINSAVTETALNANITGAFAVAIYSMIVTFVIFKIVNIISPIRVSDAEEHEGLDTTQHGETINSN